MLVGGPLIEIYGKRVARASLIYRNSNHPADRLAACLRNCAHPLVPRWHELRPKRWWHSKLNSSGIFSGRGGSFVLFVCTDGGCDGSMMNITGSLTLPV